MWVGVKDEMMEKAHVNQAEDWRCLQLYRNKGAATVL
jgi:hypothetical protein